MHMLPSPVAGRLQHARSQPEQPLSGRTVAAQGVHRGAQHILTSLHTARLPVHICQQSVPSVHLCSALSQIELRVCSQHRLLVLLHRACGHMQLPAARPAPKAQRDTLGFHSAQAHSGRCLECSADEDRFNWCITPSDPARLTIVDGWPRTHNASAVACDRPAG